MGAGRGASTHGRSATRSNSWSRCSPSVGASASMPSVRADAYGLPATTASSDALETYDRAVDALLGWDAEALDRFGAFFFQAEDGIRDLTVTGVQTCALPI